MTSTAFRIRSNKFSADSIYGTLVCAKCGEIFSRQFPLDLEGQTIVFKCPVCNSTGEADLPYKSPEERGALDLDLDPVEEGGNEVEETI